jgi:ubiquinone/menaquinone biosynthesis C-methylase UbiE
MLKGSRDSGVWLDLGCGTGWNISVLQLQKQKRKIIGIDISDKMLRFAKSKNMDVIRGDALQLPFCDNVFDGILAKGVLHHLPDIEKAIAEIARVLKSDGMAVMVDPNPSLLRKFQMFIKNKEQHFSHLHHSIPPIEYQAIISRYLEISDFRYFGMLAYPMAFPDILPLKGGLQATAKQIKTLIRLDAFVARLPIAKWFCWAFMLTGRKA